MHAGTGASMHANPHASVHAGTHASVLKRIQTRENGINSEFLRVDVKLCKLYDTAIPEGITTETWISDLFKGHNTLLKQPSIVNDAVRFCASDSVSSVPAREFGPRRNHLIFAEMPALLFYVAAGVRRAARDKLGLMSEVGAHKRPSWDIKL
ncbi:hypothetical protein EVAR_688_1 [Eumeta japonica]|uniref:Uncharacterized protein n=1 Tax=Eumeta variegata TaxID=151549 RepID=A0A4C1SBH5_EUMVA|nr:hypothetical protein EVAR_688_1 [Eumeta japonica]